MGDNNFASKRFAGDFDDEGDADEAATGQDGTVEPDTDGITANKWAGMVDKAPKNAIVPVPRWQRKVRVGASDTNNSCVDLDCADADKEEVDAFPAVEMKLSGSTVGSAFVDENGGAAHNTTSAANAAAAANTKDVHIISKLASPKKPSKCEVNTPRMSGVPRWQRKVRVGPNDTNNSCYDPDSADADADGIDAFPAVEMKLSGSTVGSKCEGSKPPVKSGIPRWQRKVRVGASDTDNSCFDPGCEGADADGIDAFPAVEMKLSGSTVGSTLTSVTEYKEPYAATRSTCITQKEGGDEGIGADAPPSESNLSTYEGKGVTDAHDSKLFAKEKALSSISAMSSPVAAAKATPENKISQEAESSEGDAHDFEPTFEGDPNDAKLLSEVKAVSSKSTEGSENDQEYMPAVRDPNDHEVLTELEVASHQSNTESPVAAEATNEETDTASSAAIVLPSERDSLTSDIIHENTKTEAEKEGETGGIQDGEGENAGKSSNWNDTTNSDNETLHSQGIKCTLAKVADLIHNAEEKEVEKTPGPMDTQVPNESDTHAPELLAEMKVEPSKSAKESSIVTRATSGIESGGDGAPNEEDSDDPEVFSELKLLTELKVSASKSTTESSFVSKGTSGIENSDGSVPSEGDAEDGKVFEELKSGSSESTTKATSGTENGDDCAPNEEDSDDAEEFAELKLLAELKVAASKSTTESSIVSEATSGIENGDGSVRVPSEREADDAEVFTFSPVSSEEAMSENDDGQEHVPIEGDVNDPEVSVELKAVSCPFKTDSPIAAEAIVCHDGAPIPGDGQDDSELDSHATKVLSDFDSAPPKFKTKSSASFSVEEKPMNENGQGDLPCEGDDSHDIKLLAESQGISSKPKIGSPVPDTNDSQVLTELKAASYQPKIESLDEGDVTMLAAFEQAPSKSATKPPSSPEELDDNSCQEDFPNKENAHDIELFSEFESALSSTEESIDKYGCELDCYDAKLLELVAEYEVPSPKTSENENGQECVAAEGDSHGGEVLSEIEAEHSKFETKCGKLLSEIEAEHSKSATISSVPAKEKLAEFEATSPTFTNGSNIPATESNNESCQDIATTIQGDAEDAKVLTGLKAVRHQSKTGTLVANKATNGEIDTAASVVTSAAAITLLNHHSLASDTKENIKEEGETGGIQDGGGEQAGESSNWNDTANDDIETLQSRGIKCTLAKVADLIYNAEEKEVEKTTGPKDIEVSNDGDSSGTENDEDGVPSERDFHNTKLLADLKEVSSKPTTDAPDLATSEIESKHENVLSVGDTNNNKELNGMEVLADSNEEDLHAMEEGLTGVGVAQQPLFDLEPNADEDGHPSQPHMPHAQSETSSPFFAPVKYLSKVASHHRKAILLFTLCIIWPMGLFALPKFTSSTDSTFTPPKGTESGRSMDVFRRAYYSHGGGGETSTASHNRAETDDGYDGKGGLGPDDPLNPALIVVLDQADVHNNVSTHVTLVDGTSDVYQAARDFALELGPYVQSRPPFTPSNSGKSTSPPELLVTSYYSLSASNLSHTLAPAMVTPDGHSAVIEIRYSIPGEVARHDYLKRDFVGSIVESIREYGEGHTARLGSGGGVGKNGRRTTQWNYNNDATTRYFTIGYTGHQYFQRDLLSSVRSSLRGMVVVVLPLALLFLTGVLGGKNLHILAVPVLTIGTSVMVWSVIMWLLCRHGGLQVTQFTPSIMMSLTVGLGVYYTLLLMSRALAESKNDRSDGIGSRRDDVVTRTLSTAGRSVLVSGITLLCAFLCLTFLPLQKLRSVGIGAAIAVLTSVAVNLVVVPALLYTDFGGRLLERPIGNSRREDENVIMSVCTGMLRRLKEWWLWICIRSEDENVIMTVCSEGLRRLQEWWLWVRSSGCGGLFGGDSTTGRLCDAAEEDNVGTASGEGTAAAAAASVWDWLSSRNLCSTGDDAEQPPSAEDEEEENEEENEEDCDAIRHTSFHDLAQPLLTEKEQEGGRDDDHDQDEEEGRLGGSRSEIVSGNGHPPLNGGSRCQTPPSSLWCRLSHHLLHLTQSIHVLLATLAAIVPITMSGTGNDGEQPNTNDEEVNSRDLAQSLLTENEDGRNDENEDEEGGMTEGGRSEITDTAQNSSRCETPQSSLWYRLSHHLLHPTKANHVLLAILAVIVPVTLQAFKMKTSISFDLMLPSSSPSMQTYRDLGVKFGMGSLSPYRIIFDGRDAGKRIDTEEAFDVMHLVVEAFVRHDINRGDLTKLENFNRWENSIIDAAETIGSVDDDNSAKFAAASSMERLAQSAGLHDYPPFQSEAARFDPFFSPDTEQESSKGGRNTATYTGIATVHGNSVPYAMFAAAQLCAERTYCPEEAFRAISALDDRATSPDRMTTYVSAVLSADPFDDGGIEWLLAARERLQALADNGSLRNFTVVVEGGAGVEYDVVGIVYDSAPAMIGLTLLVVFALMGVFFRSIVAPLRSVISICLTQGFVFGTLVLTYQWGLFNWLGIASLRGTGEISWFSPIVAFSMIVGLSLDYDIFLMNRIVEFRMEGYTHKAAVAAGLHETGWIISAAGVIMAIAFGGLMLSSSPVLFQWSFLLTVAVLFDTCVIRFVRVIWLGDLYAGPHSWWPRALPEETLDFGAHIESDHASSAEADY